QFVTVNGAWTKTRADFRDLMRRLHGPNGPFRSSTRETPEMHVRFLAPDVAVMHSRFHIYGGIAGSERPSIRNRGGAQSGAGRGDAGGAGGGGGVGDRRRGNPRFAPGPRALSPPPPG